MGRTDGTAGLFASARSDLERVVSENPDNPAFGADLGLVCHIQGLTLGFLGRKEDAIKALGRGVTVLRQIVRDNPAVEKFRNRYEYVCRDLAKWLTIGGRPDEALNVLRPARELVEAVLEKEPGHFLLGDFGAILSQTAFALAQEGEYGPAAEALDRAITIQQAALVKSEDAKLHYELACSYDLKAVLLARGPDSPGREAGRRAVELAMERLRSFVRSGYRTPHWFRHEPQLVAVRDRPDFQLLIMDLEFPAEPFAR